MRKKLVEVAIPLAAINTASAREKSIRHGHSSTLHLWWARRPLAALAAARPVLFCQGDFAGVHPCPATAGDVPDEPSARLVILGPEHVHRKGEQDSPAMEAARGMLEGKGTGPRLERNCLVFLAADRRERESLLEATAAYLAWGSICKEKEQLNLDQYLWADKDHLSFGQLAEWFPRYLYLPRVRSRETLAAAIQSGAAQTDLRDTFATATAWDEAAGRYRGLELHAALGVVDAGILVVKPAVAQAQQQREAEERAAAAGADVHCRGSGPASIDPARRRGRGGAGDPGPRGRRHRRGHGAHRERELQHPGVPQSSLRA